MKRSGDAIDEKETQKLKVEHDGDESVHSGVKEPKDYSGLDMTKKEQQEKDVDEEEEDEEEEEGDEEGEDDENPENEASRSSLGGNNTLAMDSEENTAAAGGGGGKASPPEESSDNQALVKVSYPKPKNFAERMMNALEMGIASESVWWVGGGMAIALHPAKLKESPHLKSYFKAKDYSAFIRNCNRWGFRRVATYEVPAGVVTYENSLFQRYHPHLCKHMRMDSDVQDVFARHQQTGEENSAGGESEVDKAARIIAEVKALKRDSRTNRRQRNQGVVDPTQLLQPREVTAVLPAGITDDSSLAKEYMLQKILQMTEQYLAHPGALYSDNSSMTTTMQLVRALGHQHQQSLNEFQLASIVQLQSSVQTAAQGRTPLPVVAAASLRSPVAASKPPPPSPAQQSAPAQQASLAQGTQHLLSRANLSSALGTMDLEAMLLRNQQANNEDRQLLLHQHQNQAAVDMLLAQQMRLSILGSPGTHGADSAALAALLGNATGNPPTEANPNPQGEPASSEETKRDLGEGSGGIPESPQFTTAQELLSRVMRQRKGPEGKS